MHLYYLEIKFSTIWPFNGIIFSRTIKTPLYLDKGLTKRGAASQHFYKHRDFVLNIASFLQTSRLYFKSIEGKRKEYKIKSMIYNCHAFYFVLCNKSIFFDLYVVK